MPGHGSSLRGKAEVLRIPIPGGERDKNVLWMLCAAKVVGTYTARSTAISTGYQKYRVPVQVEELSGL